MSTVGSTTGCFWSLLPIVVEGDEFSLEEHAEQMFVNATVQSTTHVTAAPRRHGHNHQLHFGSGGHDAR